MPFQEVLANKFRMNKPNRIYRTGDTITGTVIHQARFGIFLDIGIPDVRGLVERGEIHDEYHSKPLPQHLLPKLGETVTGIVLGQHEFSKEVVISLRKSMMTNAK